MNKRGISDVVIKTFQNVVKNALAVCVFQVIRFLHLVFVVLVENISVQNE